MTFIPNALELLTEQTVTGAAKTTITFGAGTGPNLDISTDRMYILMLTAKNPTGSSSRLQLYFNNDTTNAHYATEEMIASGGSITSSRLASTSELMFLEAGVTGFAIVSIIIDVDGNGRFSINNTRGNLSGINAQNLGGLWTPGANITRIDITGTIANSIGIGSVARLFRTSPV